jgi:stage V sporulation protein B
MKDNEGLAKGSSYLILSRIVFLLSGYGVHIVAARKLGPESYGVIGIIISLMTVMNLFFISGFPKAAAKYLSENKKWNINLIKKARKLQIVFLVIFFIIFLLLSPVIAYFLGDSSLTRYIIATVIVIPFYALFSLYSDGFLNGFRFFKKQAISSCIFSCSKFLLVVIFLFLGFQIIGVIAGYLIAACIGFIFALYFFMNIEISGSLNFPTEKLISFALPTILFSICILLIFNIDLFLIKAVLKENLETGLYTSASMLARVPYFIFSGLAFALLPSISYSISKQKQVQTQNQIKKSIRYMCIILIPIIALVGATAKQLIILVYSKVYIDAASALQILIFGLGFLSFFNILAHIMMGSSKPKITVIIAVLTFGTAIILNLYLIPLYSIKGAAIATTIASFLGLCIIAIQVYRFHHALMKMITFVKVILCSLIIGMIAFYVPFSGIMLLVQYSLLLLFYTALLWILKEINKKDIETIFHIIPVLHKK